ncbi:MAG TPA: adventurous gliding motility lipoprotein CglC [Archangium sp.]|uniref:adventurous gliding motility lipoprotein CglC n=1 Tax=Archangium sp. TaxID=1872627 RepID=UPI002E2F5307|nr:adventurous gliding motility lipoprotein CglC [Archangium sp.]HEX5751391.1 adventurous gliding motility lipoprotein CglC [Archangium sp.]
MSSRLALLVSAVLLCGGCKVNSDIGKRCLLVKKSTDPSRESDPVVVNDLSAGQDFISFGSLDCEDLVCVKDADMPVETADNGQVFGYCSSACVPDELVDPCPVTDPEAIESVKSRMSCRALLLDQQALDDLRQKDPATYRSYFGDSNSPYFCAGNKITP